MEVCPGSLACAVTRGCWGSRAAEALAAAVAAAVVAAVAEEVGPEEIPEDNLAAPVAAAALPSS